MAIKDKKAVLRDKRAQGIAAMGLVKREGDRFLITSPSIQGKGQVFEVFRDEQHKVRCTCPDFDERSNEDPLLRCEHILAVKHFLTPRTSEPEQKQGEQQKVETARVEAVAEKRPSKVKAVVSEEPKVEEIEPNPVVLTEQKAETATIIPMAFTNVLRTLKQPVDPRFVKKRDGWVDRKGHMHQVEYLEWHTVADILDAVAPTWSHAIRNIVQIGETVAVTASITIEGVTREGVGTGPADNETGIKKAEHDALKRAAVKFGLARTLYQKESEMVEKRTEYTKIPNDPIAKSMADLVTAKQLGMIRALGRDLSVDIETECQSLLNCKSEELSKTAASAFIEHLKKLQQESIHETILRAS
jgi:hypothetical protein